MIRFLAILIAAFAFTAPAYAAQTPDVELSLFRAVRLSNTSITLSFKTDTAAIGQLRYAQPGGSAIQLTDAAPQEDHLFTVTELDPKHGYSFTLSASTSDAGSSDYVILIAPENVGALGQSIVPGVQVMGADGSVIETRLAASSTPSNHEPIAPWWAFALLFVVVVGGWIAYRLYQRRHVRVPQGF